MSARDAILAARIDDLEHRVANLERRLMAIDELDDEIRSVELRMRELREAAEG